MNYDGRVHYFLRKSHIKMYTYIIYNICDYLLMDVEN